MLLGRDERHQSLSFGLGSLSPIPYQADLGSVVAQAAKAYNARKKNEMEMVREDNEREKRNG